MSGNLKLDWCSYSAAKYAVMHWHYSKCMPVGKLIRIGVWENDKYIGCVLFGRGAAPNLGKPYNLSQSEICELVRVALNKHITPVTKIIAISIKMVKKEFNLKLIVSFSDMNQEHYGIIYQAGNWIYAGIVDGCPSICINGKVMHKRSAGAKYGTYAIKWLHKNIDKEAHYVKNKVKYRYLYPLTKEMKNQIEHLKKPYPKACPISINGITNGFQLLDGGSIPTIGLTI